MSYHTYVVTNTVTAEAIVCCVRSSQAACYAGLQRWRLPHAGLLNVLRVPPGGHVDV